VQVDDVSGFEQQGFLVALLQTIEEVARLLKKLADKSIFQKMKNVVGCDDISQEFDTLDARIQKDLQGLQLTVQLNGAFLCGLPCGCLKSEARLFSVAAKAQAKAAAADAKAWMEMIDTKQDEIIDIGRLTLEDTQKILRLLEGGGVPQLVARVEVSGKLSRALRHIHFLTSDRNAQAGERPVKNVSRPSKNPDVFLSYRVVETGEDGDGSVFYIREALEKLGYSVFVGEQELKVSAKGSLPSQ